MRQIKNARLHLQRGRHIDIFDDLQHLIHIRRRLRDQNATRLWHRQQLPVRVHIRLQRANHLGRLGVLQLNHLRHQRIRRDLRFAFPDKRQALGFRRLNLHHLQKLLAHRNDRHPVDGQHCIQRRLRFLNR